MTPDIYARILRFVDTARERFERNIMRTEDDRAWFERNKKSQNGCPRHYRVRDTIPSDHWLFEIGEQSPKNFITIISRSPPTIVIVQVGEDIFGTVINSDEYARMRWEHLEKEYQRRSADSVQAC
jgi:hypothetical protein